MRLLPEEGGWVPAGRTHGDLVPFLPSSLSWVALMQLLRSRTRYNYPPFPGSFNILLINVH